MPEVYVKQGVVTVPQKHVPFRTITNISSKAGPFDDYLKSVQSTSRLRDTLEANNKDLK